MKPSGAVRAFFLAASYRSVLQVTQIRDFPDESYAVCPRCRTTLPREYMRYCDRCGQCLGWERF